jgi:hypothetical protein
MKIMLILETGFLPAPPSTAILIRGKMISSDGYTICADDH